MPAARILPDLDQRLDVALGEFGRFGGERLGALLVGDLGVGLYLG